MKKLRLLTPDKKHEQAAKAFIEEFYAANSAVNGAGGLDRFLDDYDSWLEKLENYRHLTPTEERVPAETYFFGL